MGNSEFKLERVTNAAPVIETDHKYIHEGIAFTVSNKMDIASNKVGAIMLAIPAGLYVHFKPTGISATGGPVIASLLEDYSIAGGSAITPVNRRRVGTPPASQVTVTGLADATAVAGAAQKTLNMLVLPGSTQGQQKLGAAGAISEEWVLKPATNYLMTFSNTSNATVTVGYELFWYEETDG